MGGPPADPTGRRGMARARARAKPVAWRKDAMSRQLLSATLVAATDVATSNGFRCEIGAGGAFAWIAIGRIPSDRTTRVHARRWAQADQPDRAAGPAGRDRPGAARPRRGDASAHTAGRVHGHLRHDAVGLADPAPAPYTHFRIASITKTMTSAVILQLAQEGKLRLGDRMSKYVPGVPERRQHHPRRAARDAQRSLRLHRRPRDGGVLRRRPDQGVDAAGSCWPSRSRSRPTSRPAPTTTTATPTTCCSA